LLFERKGGAKTATAGYLKCCVVIKDPGPAWKCTVGCEGGRPLPEELSNGWMSCGEKRKLLFCYSGVGLACLVEWGPIYMY
jgi:hypothetical protein